MHCRGDHSVVAKQRGLADVGGSAWQGAVRCRQAFYGGMSGLADRHAPDVMKKRDEKGKRKSGIFS